MDIQAAVKHRESLGQRVKQDLTVEVTGVEGSTIFDAQITLKCVSITGMLFTDCSLDVTTSNVIYMTLLTEAQQHSAMGKLLHAVAGCLSIAELRKLPGSKFSSQVEK